MIRRGRSIGLAILLAGASLATGQATYTVTNTDDAGGGSLRAAIEYANANPGPDTIRFDIAGAGPHTIQPLSALPWITDDGTALDAWSQPGWAAGAPVIEIDAVNLGDPADVIRVQADGCTIRGLVINGLVSASWTACIDLYGDNNTVHGCFLGTDVTGLVDRTEGRGGIFVWHTSGNVIGGTSLAERNVICGHLWGVWMCRDDCSGNVVQGNYIGVGADGETALGNGTGIGIAGGAFGNLIGGSAPGEGNVISGNGGNGIHVCGTNPWGYAHGNIIQGNRIGTNAAGDASVPNSGDGIYISAADDTIGGTEPGAGNVISGNGGSGVVLTGSGAHGNTVAGNTIGTNAAGDTALPNGQNGVAMEAGAHGNTVGGADEGAGNVISGNGHTGVRLEADNTLVQGNYIGTDASGLQALGNASYGILSNGSDNEFRDNVICASGWHGVSISGHEPSGSGHVLTGNLIGLGADGVTPLGNRLGLCVLGGASRTVVGGTEPGEGNVISGNGPATDSWHMEVLLKGCYDTRLVGNTIGLTAGGSSVVQDRVGVGIAMDGGSHHNLIGGVEAGAGNTVGGHKTGITVGTYQGAAVDNTFAGNYIGTDPTGTLALANEVGITITSYRNTIGGDEPGAGNAIAWNMSHGIWIRGEAAVGNRILRNSIHSNGGLGIDLGGDGVTPNDEGDADTGPNDLLNFPTFDSYSETGGSMNIGGTAPPNSTVQVFEAESDPSGYGEGEVFLFEVAVNATGVLSFSVPVSALPITATATDADGNTSEFSACVPVVVDAGDGQTLEQTGAAGTDATLDGSGSYDPAGGDLTYEWRDAGDNLLGTGAAPTVNLPLGASEITLAVTTQSGLSGADTVLVTIEDTTPPSLSLPADATVWQTTPEGTPATDPRLEPFFTGSAATDLCDASPAITDDAPVILPVGVTIVTFTATDASGNEATGVTAVTVQEADGTLVTNTNDSGFGSLRAAMDYANANPGPDTIRFDIAGAGPHVIQPATGLPTLTDAGTTVDGTTQPGYTDAPLIVLDGTAAPGAAGLIIEGSDTVIKALGISRFSGRGIYVTPTGSGTIEANEITENSTNSHGAGICITSTNTTSVVDNVVRSNTADREGGGISLVAGSDALVEGNAIEENAGSSGGGINCAATSATIRGNTVSRNSAGSGGGIHCYRCSPLVENNEVTDNSASGHGGGIRATEWDCRAVIQGNTISRNSAGGVGGGVVTWHCGAYVYYNTISDNTASNGGGMFRCGRASFTPVIGNVFSRNSAEGNGGAVWNSGSSPLYQGNQFIENTAGSGGAVLVCQRAPHMGSATFVDNVFTRNSSSGGGGAIGAGGDSMTITDNVFTDNSAGTDGGAISLGAATSLVARNEFSENSARKGGGVYVSGGSQTLTDNTFSGNASTGSGAGVYVGGGTHTLDNNTFDNNSSGYWGGGLFVYAGTVTVGNCAFTGCSAVRGGGLGAEGAGISLSIADSTFTGNTSSSAGAGLYLGSLTATVTGNRVEGNHAGDQAGGMLLGSISGVVAGNEIRGNTAMRVTYGAGGIWICGIGSAPTIRDNIIVGNSAPNGNGGGLFCAGASPTIEDNTISDNTAGGTGGGIYCCGTGVSPTIRLNVVSGNHASGGGGGVYTDCRAASVERNTLTGNTTNGNGGGVYVGSSAAAQIVGNTISANEATGGGGINVESGATADIETNAISGNTASYGGAGIRVQGGGITLTIIDNTISGNTAGWLGGGVELTWGCEATVEGNTISGNEAPHGGGVFVCRPETIATIRGNIIEHNRSVSYNGGGIDLRAVSGSTRILDNTIRCNSAAQGGGAIYTCGGSARPLIQGNAFTENEAGTYGGGIYSYSDGARPVVQDNTFTANRAGSGGAIGAILSSPVIEGNGFVRNEALHGGAIRICGSPSRRPRIYDNDFIENEAVLPEGATTAGWGGGLFSTGNSPNVEKNRFIRNKASYGGGIYGCGKASCQPHVVGNQFLENEAVRPEGADVGGLGGGVYFGTLYQGGVSPVIETNEFRGNVAALRGGGLYAFGGSSRPVVRGNNTFSANRASEAGGGVFDATSGTYEGNTITGNTAWAGGGVFCGSSDGDGAAAPTVTLNAISGNEAGEYGGGVGVGGGGPSIRENRIEGNSAPEGAGVGAQSGGATISANTIANNHGAAVSVTGEGTRCTISMNAVFDNDGLGIDLGNDGVTANDPGDADEGPNGLLNFPEYRLAKLAGGLVTAYGVAPPGSRIEVFKAAPDPSRYGEGKEFLTSTTAGPDGNFAFTVSQADLPICATATDQAGNTSEFSHVNLPPTPDAGPDQTVEQTCLDGAPVTLDASGSYDADDDPLTYRWTEQAAEGEVLLAGPTAEPIVEVMLQLGTHEITLTVTDAWGLPATDGVVVTVQDTTAPEGTAPPDITVEQTLLGGTPREDVDLGEPAVTDLCDADPDITNDAPAVFPLGETEVTWRAEDSSGNPLEDVQTVTVRDTTDPDLTVTVDGNEQVDGDVVPVEQSSLDGHTFHIEATATDTCDASPEVTLETDDEPVALDADGRVDITLQLGPHDAVVTAVDETGNDTIVSLTLEVIDTTSPNATCNLEPLEVKKHKGKFQVDCQADDLCDVDPDRVSVIETPSLEGLEIHKLKKEKELKVKFDLKKGKVDIGSPDPEATLAELQEPGGLVVVHGQVIEVHLKQGHKWEYRMHKGQLEIKAPAAVLRCTATDASGNTATCWSAADLDSEPEGCDECEGKVTELTLRYNGAEAAQVTVIQKKDDIIVFDEVVEPGGEVWICGSDDDGTFGKEVKILVDGEEHVKIKTDCSKSIGPGLVAGDFVVLEGESEAGGELCPVPGCGECRGEVTELTLRYLGAETAVIRVDQKDEGTVFQGTLEPEGELTLLGQDDEGTLGKEITIYVDGEEHVKIKTDRSRSLGPGLVFGDFLVVAGKCRDGCILCPAGL